MGHRYGATQNERLRFFMFNLIYIRPENSYKRCKLMLPIMNYLLKQ